MFRLDHISIINKNIKTGPQETPKSHLKSFKLSIKCLLFEKTVPVLIHTSYKVTIIVQ